jgi:UDP-2,4-diacetamido-2,4,6-trideoxy-beta-L-altropyranose hydrolase
MNILIRVDAHKEIALGHLNRCLNLAENLIEFGHHVSFISYEDQTAKSILSKTKFEFNLIPYKINDNKNDKEFEVLKQKSNSIDLILIDSYNVNKNYFKFLNKYFPLTAYLDDLGFDFDIDLLINPSCKIKDGDYKAKNVLSGLSYVVLANEYKLGRLKAIDLNQKKILITMGGIDHYNLTSRAIPILENISHEIEVNIVIGPYYKNIKLIKEAINKSSLTINVFENVSNLAPIILESNLALTAGGYTSFELSALSTPSVGVALWKNQYNNIDCLSSKGALIPLYYNLTENFDQVLYQELFKLVNDNDLIINMSQNARKAIDGDGAYRIGKLITKFYASS